ncbi:RNA-binding-containing protein [Coleophoma crateriformis]|uniref:RNA-binding-containing protein n=1 Tax=Coleophoma crateriformis TaxID=565419 RepID=A0A3D8Q421_9HELO|nr:RNA-binding-containing protein [Coleophoma crateriformis]
MYQDFASNRSSARGFPSYTLNRQPSRQFDTYTPLSALYQTEDNASAYESAPRFDRMTSATLQSSYAPYDSQTWNYGGANGASTMGGGRMRAPVGRRPGLPTPWLEPQQAPPMPSIPSSHLNGQYSTQAHLQNSRVSPPTEDELIPTAIVIKNIPFAVKKEQLVAVMTEMNLPLPYAFNYHFDNGVFRGLAFANFTTSEETQMVIEQMNHMEIAGRKLRVEYKKMLPLAERDRIERDKRERRGQLQEQHQPIPQSALHHQASMSSMNSAIPTTSPSPVNTRSDGGGIFGGEVDMNDPTTLSLYGELTVFKRDNARDTLVFAPDLTPHYRRQIHTLAHHMKLDHQSEGAGPQRHVVVYKKAQDASPPQAQAPNYYNESQRRGLNRAATIDFGEARQEGSFYNNHTLGRQTSGLLDIPGSPGLGNQSQNLRGVKSFADLRSFSPSPVPTTASYPANHSQNVSRYTEYGQSTGPLGTPNLTPTSSGNPMNVRDESYLLNGLGNLSLGGYDRSTASRSNGRLGGQSDRDTHVSTAGPIGSQRPNTNGLYEENQRNGASAVPERQPRGPGSEWGTGSGFGRPRQNGHTNQGSGDSSDRSGPLSATTRYMS